VHQHGWPPGLHSNSVLHRGHFVFIEGVPADVQAIAMIFR
jgi:hypothetical protein